MRSARHFFRLQITVGAVGAVAVVAALATAARATAFATPGPEPMWHACRALLPAGASPASAAVLALLGIAGFAVWRGAVSAIRQLRASRALLAGLGAVERRGIHGRSVNVFAGAQPRAFCAGNLRPRVFVSSAALRCLRADELAAVLAHEHHHAQRRDPLRLTLAQVMSDALFFLPVMRDARRRYALLAELAADEAAVERSGGVEPLASALLRFDEHGGAAVGIAAERVDHLLGARPSWRLPASAAIAAAMARVALIGVSAAMGLAAPAGEVPGSVVAMQVCALTMVAVPVLAAVAVFTVARRALAARGR